MADAESGNQVQQRRYDPTEKERFGVNEIDDARETLGEGDHLRLHVTYGTKAAGEQSDSFEADVEKVHEDGRIDLETEFEPHRSKSPPQPGDWYIEDWCATAMREQSRIPYSIDSMDVWRANDAE